MNEEISAVGLYWCRCKVVVFYLEGGKPDGKVHSEVTEKIVSVRDPDSKKTTMGFYGIYRIEEILRPLDPEIDFEECLRWATENVA